MSFTNVNKQKLRSVLELFINTIDAIELAAKWRASHAAKDKHYRFFGTKFTQRHGCIGALTRRIAGRSVTGGVACAPFGQERQREIGCNTSDLKFVLPPLTEIGPCNELAWF